MSASPEVVPDAPASAHAQLPYVAPLREMNFVLNEVHDAPAHYQKLGFEDCTPDFLDAINSECAKVRSTGGWGVGKEGKRE